MPADSRFSAGARLERKVMVARLRRMLKQMDQLSGPAVVAYNTELAWLLKRQARYSKKKGGL